MLAHDAVRDNRAAHVGGHADMAAHDSRKELTAFEALDEGLAARLGTADCRGVCGEVPAAEESRQKHGSHLRTWRTMTGEPGRTSPRSFFSIACRYSKSGVARTSRNPAGDFFSTVRHRAKEQVFNRLPIWGQAEVAGVAAQRASPQDVVPHHPVWGRCRPQAGLTPATHARPDFAYCWARVSRPRPRSDRRSAGVHPRRTGDLRSRCKRRGRETRAERDSHATERCRYTAFPGPAHHADSPRRSGCATIQAMLVRMNVIANSDLIKRFLSNQLRRSFRKSEEKETGTPPNSG